MCWLAEPRLAEAAEDALPLEDDLHGSDGIGIGIGTGKFCL